jgi:isoquinoline 1-oxidoreductase alpha subunit
MNLNVNQTVHAVGPDWQGDTLLAVLREHLGLCGPKYGCGTGLCGACTVLLDGQPQRACVLPVAAVTGRAVTTVEGFAEGERLHPVQQAWLDESVAQCGYCQAGQIVAAVALLRATPKPDDAQIDAALAGHLCRCGTQQRVRAAIHRAAGQPARSQP